jgi:branched-chain amino acid transport system ATP-binding protein
VLDVCSLEVSYGDVQAVFDVSLEVGEGEIVTLLGSNGAGKTTTLRAIAGLLRARGGEIAFEGRSLLATPGSIRAELGIALVPEGRDLWPQLTVEENLRLGAYCRRARPHVHESLRHVFDVFPRLDERRRQLAGSLSGGEQQMCAIGRALMARPRLLMLDEPSLGLSPKLVDQVFATIRQLHLDGLTVLLVEQNLKAALEIADRGYVVETGRVTLSGTSSELRANADVRASYLGV